jgi:hypothetical protein
MELHIIAYYNAATILIYYLPTAYKKKTFTDL